MFKYHFAFVLFFVMNCFAQSSSENLNKLGLHRFPELKDLQNLSLDNSAISTSSVNTENINDNFSNISDLKWLKQIAAENKAIFIGENHYYKYTNQLRNRILFALNTFEHFPLLVLENQYSLTGFANHYINCKEEKVAEKFFQTELSQVVNTKEIVQLLQLIRKWNMKNPTKTIQLGFSDIEHNYIATLRKIIFPYFQAYNFSFPESVKIKLSDLKTLIPEFRSLLINAKKDNLIGKYPFITSQYIESVIDNIESTYNAIEYSLEHYRQKAIVRNLTDEKFLGRLWIGKKVLIHGGAYHTTTNYKYPEDGNFLREGSYLEFEFPYTKGKTYSIRIIGFARSISQVADLNLDKCGHVGGGYHYSFTPLQKAFKRNLISKDEAVFQYQLNSVDSLFVKRHYFHNQNGIVIKDISWEQIKKDADKETMQKISKFSKEYYWYDKTIFIMKSPITEMLEIKK